MGTDAPSVFADVLEFLFYFFGVFRAYLAYSDYQTLGWSGMKWYDKWWLVWGLFGFLMLVLKCYLVATRKK